MEGGGGGGGGGFKVQNLGEGSKNPSPALYGKYDAVICLHQTVMQLPGV